MPQVRPSELPRWLVVLASIAIVYHLGAIVLAVLAAPSGPWPTMEGGTTFTRPQFAFTLHNTFALPYLKLVKMTNKYDPLLSQPGQLGASFEVRLRDEKKQEIAVLRFPEDDANFWVRHRQSLLARWLTIDQPVSVQISEQIPAPNKPVPTVTFWDNAKPQLFHLRDMPQNLVPRDRPVFSPSEFSLLHVRSYARYLCQKHGAASAEVIRRTQEAFPPSILSGDNVQEDFYKEVRYTFGELPR